MGFPGLVHSVRFASSLVALGRTCAATLAASQTRLWNLGRYLGRCLWAGGTIRLGAIYHPRPLRGAPTEVTEKKKKKKEKKEKGCTSQ